MISSASTQIRLVGEGKIHYEIILIFNHADWLLSIGISKKR